MPCLWEVRTPRHPVPGAGAAVPPLLCLQLFLFRTVTLRPPHNFTQCTTRGSFPQPWHETLYNMVGFAGLFLLPLLIMVCCYARILLEISRRMGSSFCECLGTGLPCPHARGALQGPWDGGRRREPWLGLCGDPPALGRGVGSLSQPGHQAFPAHGPCPPQSPPGTCRCGAPGATSRGHGCAC